MKLSRLDWFWRHVTTLPSDCWQWNGARRNGYAQMLVDGKQVSVHLWSYEQFIGPRPTRLVADHICHKAPCTGGILCEHRRCVNPRHIQFVTNGENTARQAKTWVPTCKNGHPWTEKTTRYITGNRRQCTICQNKRALDSYYRVHPEKKDRRLYL